MYSQVNEHFIIGTNAERIAAAVARIDGGTVFFETDTNKSYIVIAGAWQPFAQGAPAYSMFKFSGLFTPPGSGAKAEFLADTGTVVEGDTAALAYPAGSRIVVAALSADTGSYVISGGTTITFTLYKNGSPTSLAVVFAAGQSGIRTATGSVTLEVTDSYGVQIAIANSAGASPTLVASAAVAYTQP